MTKYKYTMENFKLESVIEEAIGRWSNKNPYFYGISSEGKFDINYSSILTILIQAAGRICRCYASDLFISWSSLEKELNNPEYEGGKYLFGMREMGVDHNTYVLSRLNNYGKEQMEKDIKELYLLEVKVEKSNVYATITMFFGKARLTED